MSTEKSGATQSFKDLVEQLPETIYGEQKTWSTGKITFEMFPEGYIALNKELATGLHTKLYALLANNPRADDVDVRLAEIASYCSVLLDGTYTIAERDKLCYILTGRLEVLRDIAPPTVILQ
jgi:hypothetical protein